jgi:hypothetical protein
MNKSQIRTLVTIALNTQKSTCYTPAMITAVFDNMDGTICVCTNDDYVYTVIFDLS